METVGNMHPGKYVLSRLNRLKRDSLAQMLKFLHFEHLRHLLKYVRYGLDNRIFPDLCFRILQIVTQTHRAQIFNHSETLHLLKVICQSAEGQIVSQTNVCRDNLQALKLFSNELNFMKS